MLHPEWEMKLWWVHCEAMVALLMGYVNTNNPKLWERFKTVADYVHEHVRNGYAGCGGSSFKFLRIHDFVV